jgi:hypothetical protein
MKLPKYFSTEDTKGTKKAIYSVFHVFTVDNQNSIGGYSFVEITWRRTSVSITPPVKATDPVPRRLL